LVNSTPQQMVRSFFLSNAFSTASISLFFGSIYGDINGSFLEKSTKKGKPTVSSFA
jgi:hypothetical protein